MNWVKLIDYGFCIFVGALGPEVWGNMVRRYYKARGPLQETYILKGIKIPTDEKL